MNCRPPPPGMAAWRMSGRRHTCIHAGASEIAKASSGAGSLRVRSPAIPSSPSQIGQSNGTIKIKKQPVGHAAAVFASGRADLLHANAATPRPSSIMARVVMLCALGTRRWLEGSDETPMARYANGTGSNSRRGDPFGGVAWPKVSKSKQQRK